MSHPSNGAGGARREDGLGPPPAFVLIGRGRRGRGPGTGRQRIAIGIAVGLVVLFILASVAKTIYLDLLWFRSVGYSSVYTTRITTRIWLFLFGGILAAVTLAANVLVARRLAPSADEPGFEVSPELQQLYQSLTHTGTRRAIMAVAGVLIG